MVVWLLGGLSAGQYMLLYVDVLIVLQTLVHGFILNCNGLLGFIETVCYSDACFEVELRTSHGLLLASTGLFIDIGLLLCCYIG